MAGEIVVSCDHNDHKKIHDQKGNNNSNYNINKNSSHSHSNNLLEYVRKSSPPPFLLKTYMLVEDPATEKVISWNKEGTAFVVWQPAEFARDLLPTLFKHSNFSSFVRQLNTYGFRKVAVSRWEFCNDKFKKGGKELLCEIRRRKAWATNIKKQQQNQPLSSTTPHPDHQFDEDQRSSSSTNSSSSDFTTLIHENKRLKRENGVLSTELSSMRNKCKVLLDLVARCNNNKTTLPVHDDHGTRLDKEEVEQEETNKCDHHRQIRAPKVFGVRLEVGGEIERKRKRGGEVLSSAQSCK